TCLAKLNQIKKHDLFSPKVAIPNVPEPTHQPLGLAACSERCFWQQLPPLLNKAVPLFFIFVLCYRAAVSGLCGL
ncbi:hypothetical protein QG049_10320, partial [Kingella kingae]|uniref:hypothetical protein n=1 Tax=Kingella kingae TaxID=504 RepID=UPI00254B4F59